MMAVYHWLVAAFCAYALFAGQWNWMGVLMWSAFTALFAWLAIRAHQGKN